MLLRCRKFSRLLFRVRYGVKIYACAWFIDGIMNVCCDFIKLFSVFRASSPLLLSQNFFDVLLIHFWYNFFFNFTDTSKTDSCSVDRWFAVQENVNITCFVVLVNVRSFVNCESQTQLGRICKTNLIAALSLRFTSVFGWKPGLLGCASGRGGRDDGGDGGWFKFQLLSKYEKDFKRTEISLIRFITRNFLFDFPFVFRSTTSSLSFVYSMLCTSRAKQRKVSTYSQ